MGGVVNEKVDIRLKGVPGYREKQVVVPTTEGTDSNNRKQIYMDPIGSVIVSLTPQSSPYFRLNGIEKSEFTDQDLLTAGLTSVDVPANYPATRDHYLNTFLTYHYNNDLFHENTLNAKIRVEGTDIQTSVSVPATKKYNIKLITSSITSVNIDYYLPNFIVGTQIDNVPGGQQTLSVVLLPGYDVQKNLQVNIPGNDIIATEVITVFRSPEVLGVGDIRGTVLDRVTLAPIPNALVYVENSTSNPVLTNSKGEYIIPQVEHGTRIVSVEVYTRANVEPYTDGNLNGKWDALEIFTDLNGNGVQDGFGEGYTDLNGNGRYDIGEPFQDANGNRVYDSNVKNATYVPNKTVEVNVQEGLLNEAPPIYMDKRVTLAP